MIYRYIGTATLALGFLFHGFSSPIHINSHINSHINKSMKHVDEADFSHANHHLLNAITFDDGPNIWTHELLDYLDLKKVKVTFFVNGQNYNSILDPGMTEVVKRAFAAGHQIGSHTWSHADISQPSTDLAIEMSKLDDALLNILGVRPGYMRPPYSLKR